MADDMQLDLEGNPLSLDFAALLGWEFLTDDERRESYLHRVRTAMDSSELTGASDFPKIASEDSILSLADPPFYTPCKNSFLREIVHQLSSPDQDGMEYHREPFAVDIKEGKTSLLYKAHSYHTKLPPQAVAQFILYYTEPGDLVLDGFSGTGMTGVGARLAASPPAKFKKQIEDDWSGLGYTPPVWGPRPVLLGDLSPVATFISHNYCHPFDTEHFRAAAESILQSARRDIGWMYETKHPNGAPGKIQYTVWSDVFLCPDCQSEVVFLEEALDPVTKKTLKDFPCPHCAANLRKTAMTRSYESFFDRSLGRSIRKPKRVPWLIAYKVGKEKYEKRPDDADIELLRKIEALPIPEVVPTHEIPFMHMTHQRQKLETYGITHLHHFFLSRQAHSLAHLWSKAVNFEGTRIRNVLLFFVEQLIWTGSLLNRFRPTGFSQVNQYLTGTFYVASQVSEISPWYCLDGKLDRLYKAFKEIEPSQTPIFISTQDCANWDVDSETVDYIFTDPPFGENIYYSDLNYLVESWHGVLSNATNEAIVDKAKGKSIDDYSDLMLNCFKEYFRVLKKGRWMTVVFHNSHNAVWNAIQSALQTAGFVVADVSALDTKMGSFRQVTSTAVKQDLLISCFKPRTNYTTKLGVAVDMPQFWELLSEYLRNLPVWLGIGKEGRFNMERTADRLFDTMIAIHLTRGLQLPIGKVEFVQELDSRFPQREGMYFLPDQLVKYDRERIRAERFVSVLPVVVDEKTAVTWLQFRLRGRPASFQNLQPEFMKASQQWRSTEATKELKMILEENFVEDERGRWKQPDPSRARELDQLRRRRLLKEFDRVVQSKGKLDQIPSEAIYTGFEECYKKQDFESILAIGRRLKSATLEENQKLSMWISLARKASEG